MAKAKRNIEPKIEPVEKPVRKRAYNRKVKEPEQPIETIPPTSEKPPNPAPMKTFYKRYKLLFIIGIPLLLLLFLGYKWVNPSLSRINKKQQKAEQKATKDLNALEPQKEAIKEKQYNDSIALEKAIREAYEAGIERKEAELQTQKQKTANKNKENDTKQKIRRNANNPDELDRILEDLLRARKADENH